MMSTLSMMETTAAAAAGGGGREVHKIEEEEEGTSPEDHRKSNGGDGEKASREEPIDHEEEEEEDHDDEEVFLDNNGVELKEVKEISDGKDEETLVEVLRETPIGVGGDKKEEDKEEEEEEEEEGRNIRENGEEMLLSSIEENGVQEFLVHVNSWRDSGGFLNPLDRKMAIKFLMARKFNVDRSLVLYQQHEIMRQREGLYYNQLDLESEKELAQELKTGKFTILPGKDKKGATLALFHAHKHDPSLVSQKTTLKGVVYQLDAALEDLETQRGGLVFIYNMSGSKYSNFDYDLSQKMLTLLKGCYPARLKKVLIVMAPLWFKAPFKVLRLFVQEKLRDRVVTVSIPQLISHIPVECIPEEMGGKLNVDHQDWLQRCQSINKSKENDMSSKDTSATGNNSDQPTLEQFETLTHSLRKADDNLNNGSLTETNHVMIPQAASNANSTSVVSGLLSSVSSGLSEEDAEDISEEPGMDVLEFIKHVRVKGRRGLYDEYFEIKKKRPSGTFDNSNCLVNSYKNRYSDVLCFDHSRVQLIQHVDDSDYINANYVDAYKQPKAFISTQGPLDRTFAAFWRMVWEQRVQVIVMTTKTLEQRKSKCGQYWPQDIGKSLVIESMSGEKCYEIHSQEIQNYDDFIVTHLTLQNSSTDETRSICHFQFVSWPDYGVPQSALSMLHFLQCVRDRQQEMTTDLGDSWTGHPLGPPIIVHCSAGIGRTGTFATLDSAIRKYEDIGKVDIRSTVERIRSQRAYSIQMPDQYVFCHLAFLEYVLNMEYVDEIDLTGFDDECDSE